MLSILSYARKALIWLIPGATVLGLAACVSSTGGNGPSIDPSAPVPVALLVPSGSGQSSDEFLARSLENGARLAIADLGDTKIDLRVYPTGASPAQASAAATKAVDDGAKIILGPVFAEEANAAGVAVASRGVSVLSFSNNPAIAGGNVFVLGPTFANTADRLAQYAVSHGKPRIMIVHDQTAAGEIGRAAIETAVRSAGGTVSGVSGYEFSQNGLVATVPGIAASAQGNADALFLTADTAGALPLLTQLLRENGLPAESSQFIGLTRWDIPPQTLALPGVQGGWFALPDPGLYQQYVARYTAAYGSAPPPVSGLAYDGIAAIGALIRQGGADALARQRLTQGSGFVGVGGIFRLNSDGTNQRGLAVAQIQNSQVVVIDPAPRSFGGAGL